MYLVYVIKPTTIIQNTKLYFLARGEYIQIIRVKNLTILCLWWPFSFFGTPYRLNIFQVFKTNSSKVLIFLIKNKKTLIKPLDITRITLYFIRWVSSWWRIHPICKSPEKKKIEKYIIYTLYDRWNFTLRFNKFNIFLNGFLFLCNFSLFKNLKLCNFSC